MTARGGGASSAPGTWARNCAKNHAVPIAKAHVVATTTPTAPNARPSATVSTTLATMVIAPSRASTPGRPIARR